MATIKSAKKGGRQHRDNTTLDLPLDLYKLYKSDPDESYTQQISRVQRVRGHWAEEWFKYYFVTPEYAKKNDVRPPWADIVYRKLSPKMRAEAIAQGFYPCVVRGPQPENATHPVSDGV